MAICASCGHDVSGKKFCPACGTAVQPQAMAVCPRCQGEVKPGAAFCVHCGFALAQSAVPATRACPSCQTQVAAESAFCTNCGHDMRAPVAQPASVRCTQCGYQNPAGTRFCSGCGIQLASAAPAGYAQANAYPQYAQNPQQYPQQPTPGYQQPYQQGQYPQYPQYQQPYGQAQYGQNVYQPQPMAGQAPMVLRCPTCMAMAPLGTAYCVSCRTNLAGVVPMPANMPMQPMQGQPGGFLQGNGGKLAMGALGGAAAVIGGEMLLHGLEHSVENRVEDDMGFGQRQRHRDEGLLGGLGELADDIGL